LQRWGREDARGAFATLMPHLEEAVSGVLPVAVELQVHTLAATLYASPDGKLFDAEKSDAHVARAEALLASASQDNPETRCHLRMAELACGFYLGDAERIARCSGRMAASMEGVKDPVLRLLAEDACAHEAGIRGEAAQATRRFREVAQGAARLGYPFLEARNLSFLAQRRLEEACDPAEALQLVRRAREAAYGGRMVRGFSFIFTARAECEALLRLSRYAEAEAVLDEADAVVEELSWTPLYTAVQRAVLWLVTGKHAELRRFAARLSSYDGTIQRPLTRAYGLFAEAMADFSEGHLLRAADGYAAAGARAMELGGWPLLRRECLVYETGARAFAGQLSRAAWHCGARASSWSGCPPPGTRRCSTASRACCWRWRAARTRPASRWRRRWPPPASRGTWPWSPSRATCWPSWRGWRETPRRTSCGPPARRRCAARAWPCPGTSPSPWRTCPRPPADCPPRARRGWARRPSSSPSSGCPCAAWARRSSSASCSACWRASSPAARRAWRSWTPRATPR
ncbi:hypothetical protein ACLESO_56840, partial [Pyxidicoccus sp. 3LG]